MKASLASQPLSLLDLLLVSVLALLLAKMVPKVAKNGAQNDVKSKAHPCLAFDTTFGGQNGAQSGPNGATELQNESKKHPQSYLFKALFRNRCFFLKLLHISSVLLGFRRPRASKMEPKGTKKPLRKHTCKKEREKAAQSVKKVPSGAPKASQNNPKWHQK